MISRREMSDETEIHLAVPVQHPAVGYRVYRRRWLLLSVILITQVTNGAAWLSFSPVASFAASYYGVSVQLLSWQMTQFLVVQLLVTPLVMCSGGRCSFRWLLVMGAVLNGLGLVIKGGSTWQLITPAHLQFPLTMLGSVLAAVAQPFTLVISTRYSQTWHPPRERTLTTTLTSLANPVGCMLGLSVTPLYVHGPADVPLINTVWAMPALIIALVAAVGINSSEPPTPPSRSAACCDLPASSPLATLRQLGSCRPLLWLLASFGPAVGVFNCVATLLGQMLCSRGYTGGFIGLCGLLLFGFGIPGSLLLDAVAVNSGQMIFTAKLAYSLTALSYIVLTQALRYDGMQWLIGVGMALFGALGVGMYPLMLELGVEATYPTDPTYSNSLIFIPGSLIGALLVMMSAALGSPLSAADTSLQTCSTSPSNNEQADPLDYTNFFLLSSALLVVSSMSFLVGFDTPYLRRDRDEMSESSLSGDSTTTTATTDDRSTQAHL